MTTKPPTKPRKAANPDAAPSHLGEAGRALWTRLIADFGLRDAAARALLQSAAECCDRIAEAREAIARDGAVVLDRFNQRKSHPLLAAERDARAGLVAALRGLGLHGAPEEGNEHA